MRHKSEFLTHHVLVHPDAAAQLHIDVAVVLEKHVRIVRHDVLVTLAAHVLGVAAVVSGGLCARLLGVASLAHAGPVLLHAHASAALVHHVLLDSIALALLNARRLVAPATGTARAVLVHHWQARAAEGIHCRARLGHVLLSASEAHDNVRVGLAALLELNDVHGVLGLPGLAVLVLIKGALAQVLNEGLQLEAEDPVDHVCPVLPRLAWQQGTGDLSPMRVAGHGDEERAFAVHIGHCD